MISDLSMEYPESLKVTKDNTMKNTYWVSYTTIAGPSPTKELNPDVQVQIHVVVVKENGQFKIDKVLNPFDGVKEIP